tara:strand:- start:4029 stop:4163 length:135 start_codon:yes stop_codon:yes gene_type:complete
MRTTLKDGIVKIILYECPICGEREGYRFTIKECGCSCLGQMKKQ